MDPNATVQRLISAVYAKDADEANEAYCDLRDWIRKGGFAPEVSTEDLLSLMAAASLYCKQSDNRLLVAGACYLHDETYPYNPQGE